MMRSVNRSIDLQYLHEFNGCWEDTNIGANMLSKHDVRGYFENIQNTLKEEKKFISTVTFYSIAFLFEL